MDGRGDEFPEMTPQYVDVDLEEDEGFFSEETPTDMTVKVRHSACLRKTKNAAP